ncbi:hypothetical protein EVAR_4223_1 [Eumeta japonica]|uniref:Uncharacterized protein n=1 Tax=Eumeta variegata TaxID=151549 RepID=A0A4C1TH60_EUMVA|nr:hypothetical protein EVAR_4223_1 [Eumeta japonica]
MKRFMDVSEAKEDFKDRTIWKTVALHVLVEDRANINSGYRLVGVFSQNVQGRGEFWVSSGGRVRCLSLFRIEIFLTQWD